MEEPAAPSEAPVAETDVVDIPTPVEVAADSEPPPPEG
jgi:hypothetical protein